MSGTEGSVSAVRRRLWAGILSVALVAGLVTVLPASPAAAAPNPTPVATLSANPNPVMIGQSLTYTVTFDNDSANDPTTPVGYGPYVDLRTPLAGADGNDGVTVTSATYLGQALSMTTITCTGAAVVHPLTGLSVACPASQQLHVITYPFGSFTPLQPVAPVTVSASLSPLADLGTALTATATPGFRFGASATGGPPIVGSAVSTSVVPTLATIRKTDSSPEAETPPGPNYPRRYTMTVDVANGQTVTDLHVRDRLPADAVYLGVVAPTTPAYTIVREPAVGVTSAGAAADLDVRFASVTGGAGATDATVTVAYYVAAVSATGTPTVGLAAGAWTTTPNTATGSLDWTPTDVRDPAVNDLAIGPAAPGADTVTRTNKPLVVEKAVANLTHPGGPNLPGDTLEYTLTWNVSDYLAMDQIRIPNEVVSDGQVLDPFAPRFTWADRTDSIAAPFAAGTWTSTVRGCGVADAGSTLLSFDLSAAAQAAGAADGVITGGRFGGSGPAAGGTVVFRTRIASVYACPESVVSDRNINQGDSVGNRADITGRQTTNGATVPTDTTATTTTIGQGSLAKSIYAVNGSTTLPSPLQLAVGDTVTYRLTETITTANFEDYRLTDYLPLPVLRATEVTAFNPVVGLPVAGRASYGPSDTLHLAAGAPDPTLSTDAAGNEVRFAYGTFDVPGRPVTLTTDLLFTVTVGNAPFADGLYLTNQVRSQQANSQATASVDDKIVGITLAQPSIKLRKGAVATSRAAGATFTPAGRVPTGVVFTPSAGSFTGSITSATIGTTMVSDLSGVDAGDLVTFAVTAENVGHGPYGAYDLTLRDTCPAGFDCSTVTGFTVTNGARAALAYAGTTTDFFGASGIRLTSPLPTCATFTTGTCADATGANVVVVTYTLPVSATVRPATTATNTATTLFYSNTNVPDAAGNPPRSFVPIDGQPDTDAATVTSRALTIAKALTATSATGTTGTNLAVGETATYTLTVTVPEGVAPAFTMVDTLPNGRMRATGVASVVCSAGLSSTLAVCGNPAAVTGVGTNTLTATFGDLTNADRVDATAETIVITYSAVVLDALGNQAGTANPNNARATYTGPTGSTVTRSATPVSTTVVEPVLTLAKSATPSAADAGDLVTFTLVVAHPGGATTSPAYDVVLSDTFPAAFTAVTLGPVTGPARCTAGTVTLAGSALTGAWPELQAGESCQITLTATFGGTGTSVNGDVVNTATVTWTSLPGAVAGERTGADGPGGALDDYAVRATAAVSPRPSVTKTVAATDLAATPGSTVTVGETVTYELAVRVPEGTTTGGLTVRDLLPTGMQMVTGSTVVDTTGFAGTLPGSVVVTEPPGFGGTVTWRWNGDVVVPATTGSTANTFRIRFAAIVLDVAGNVARPAPTALANAVTVQGDGGPLVNGTGATVTVAEPLLTLTKDVVELRAAVGDPVTVRLTVANTGTAPAYDVVVVDPLPAQLAYSALVSAPGFTLTSTSPVTFSGGTLLPGASAVLEFTAVVQAGAAAGSTISNAAAADGDTWPGPNPQQRGEGVPGAYHVTATDSLVVSVPNLVVTKTDGVTAVSPGQALTYLVTVRNAGDRDATGVVAVDTLPARTTFVAAPANGTCPAGALSGGQVTFAVGSIAAGASVVCRVDVRVDRPLPPSVSTVVNSATATEDGTHGSEDTSDNTGTDTDTVTGAPNLSVAKDDARAVLRPGETTTYTVTVTNNGPIDASSVQVSDTLPPHTTLVDSFGGTGVAVGGTGTLTWAVGDVAGDGGTATVRVSVRVDPTLPAGVGALTNTATAQGLNTTPASGSDTDGLDAAPDLRVTKDDGTQTRHPGDGYDYTLTVRNVGDQDATGVTVTDTLPPGVVCLPAGAPGSNTSPGTCDNTAGTVVFGAALAAGATATFTVTVRVDDPAPAGLEQLVNRVVVADDGSNGPDPTPSDNADSDTDTLAAAPQLAVAKSDGVASTTPGATLTYTLTVTNAGDQDTTAAQVVDTLPAGTTFVSATGSPARVGDTLTWSGVTVAVGTPTVLTVVVTVDDPATAGRDSVTNTVTVTDAEGTPPGGVTATDTDTLTAAPDLVVTKTNGVSVLDPGDPVTYTVTVRNVGNQDATGVVVTDVLPAALDRSAGAVTLSPAGSYAPSTGTATWAVGDLAAGSQLVLTLSTTVRDPLPAGTTTVANTARAADDGSNGPDPTPSDNQATDVDPVGPNAVPDLAVTKDDGVGTTTPGAVLAYTVTATNLGPADAADVVVTDTLPPATTVVDADGGTVDTGAGTVTWVVPLLGGNGPGGAGSTATFTLRLRVDPAVPAGLTALTNRVTVDDGPGGDVPDSKNVASDTDTLVATPDLVVTKDDGVDQTAEGDRLTYTVTVRNAGDQDATGVVVTDTLGSGLVLVDGDGATVSGPTLTWTVGALAAGASRTLTVVVDVGDLAPGTATVSNTASAADDGSNGSDPTPSDNEATDTDAVGVDLAVTKSNGLTELVAGEPTTWTVTVTNGGPATVTALHVDDPTPSGVVGEPTFAVSEGAYDAGTGAWTGLDLAEGESVTLSVTATVDPAYRGTVVNAVTVTPVGVPETDPTDNSATDADPVVAVADVGVTKSHEPARALPGDRMTWTLVVTNTGPSVADDVVVVDTLPAGVGGIAVDAADPWACEVVERTVTCTRATLGVGQQATVTVAASVEATEGAIDNTVTVSTASSDPNPDNDSFTDPLTVAPWVDLALTKTLVSTSLTPGGTATYRIEVVNNGHSAARDPIVVTDTPQAGLSDLAGSGPGWACTRDGSALVCTTDADLGPGERAPVLTVTATVSARAGGSVANSASVPVGATDWTPDDNADVASATLGAGGGGGGGLPHTGADVLRLLVVALLLGLAGTGLVRVAGRSGSRR